VAFNTIAFLFAAVASSAQVSPPAQSAAPAGDPNVVPEKCKIEGRVVSLATGVPLKKATMRLRATVQTASPGTQPTITNYTSATDAEGKFLFEDLDAGTYILSADRTGYVSQSYGASQPNRAGSPIKLSAGQQLKDLVMKLTPQGMIYGKVTDEDGDPVPNADVRVMRWGYLRGKKQLQWEGGSNVQADGSFVVGNLAAGRYYLTATDNRNRTMGMTEKPGRKGPEEDYVTTYFPNALDPSAASPIEVNAGAELRGIEIRLRKARVFHVRGRVVNTLTGATPQNMMLTITPKDNSEFMFGRNMQSIRGKDGSFEFNNVSPGTYIVQPNGGASVTTSTDPVTGETIRSARLVGRAVVSVSDDNVENVVVALGAGVDVTGTLKIEGGETQQPAAATPGAKPPALPTIIVTPAEVANFNSIRAQSKDDGTFQLRGIAPDVYRINVIGLPDGAYLKSIRFGGQEVTKSTVDLSSGASGQLDILISPNAADVTGVVRNSKGEAVQGVMVQIWLPDEDIAKTANTDQAGNFKLSGLAPGEYHMVAWEDIEPGLSQDPAFRARFDSQATTVKLRDNSHETVEVKLIGKDAIETEAAKAR
jgi:uncharacterized surface anchored protein